MGHECGDNDELCTSKCICSGECCGSSFKCVYVLCCVYVRESFNMSNCMGVYVSSIVFMCVLVESFIGLSSKKYVLLKNKSVVSILKGWVFVSNARCVVYP